MKRKNKDQTRLWTVVAASGVAAVAVATFAAYRSTVNRLVPTSTNTGTSSKTYTFSAPAVSTPNIPDVPVQNNVTNVPKPSSSAPTSSDVPANKPIIADVGNILPVDGEVSH